MSYDFLKNIKVFERFEEAMRPEGYEVFPEDWYVVVTDVKSSTQAIKDGKYKSVNILGVSVIAGILNKSEEKGLPYVFGGDGAALVIPPELRDTASQVLQKAKEIAQKAYGLELRTAIIPLSKLKAHGSPLKVAFFQVSPNYKQALFWGDGLSYAEMLLKSSSEFEVSDLSDASNVTFAGIECRWEPVRSSKGETVTIMAEAIADKDEERAAIYFSLLKNIEDILGVDPGYHPIVEKNVKMGLGGKNLLDEVKLRTFGATYWERVKYVAELRLRMALGWFLMKYKIKTEFTNWGDYKPDLIANSDYRKFDGMFRAVLNASSAQRERLEQWLDQEFTAGKLIYGIHTSDTALVTCMVFKYQGEHVHFVDGNHGGYALAANSFKERRNLLLNKKNESRYDQI